MAAQDDAGGRGGFAGVLVRAGSGCPGHGRRRAGCRAGRAAAGGGQVQHGCGVVGFCGAALGGLFDPGDLFAVAVGLDGFEGQGGDAIGQLAADNGELAEEPGFDARSGVGSPVDLGHDFGDRAVVGLDRLGQLGLGDGRGPALLWCDQHPGDRGIRRELQFQPDGAGRVALGRHPEHDRRVAVAGDHAGCGDGDVRPGCGRSPHAGDREPRYEGADPAQPPEPAHPSRSPQIGGVCVDAVALNSPPARAGGSRFGTAVTWVTSEAGEWPPWTCRRRCCWGLGLGAGQPARSIPGRRAGRPRPAADQALAWAVAAVRRP